MKNERASVLRAAIEGRLAQHPGLYLGGNAYRGVALNDCTEQGEVIAQRIQQISDELLRVQQGSLYPALHRLEQHGLRFSGLSPDGVLPEIVEYEDHPWFIGVQFHPELKSRPFEPHPLFASFIEAAVVQSRLV